MEDQTQDLIEVLKDNIKNNKDAEMQAVIGRIPLLCKSVLDIHEVLKEVKIGQEKLNEKLDNKFVSKETFNPIQKIIYGGVGLVLTAVLGAIVVLIIK